MIVEGLSPSPERDQHRGNFCSWARGRNFGFPAINLLTSFLPSPKAAPGVFAIRNWSELGLVIRLCKPGRV
jgi:hypothetical protein